MTSQLPAALALLAVSSFAGPPYPFKGLPGVVSATLDVDTGKVEPANNKLLGTNIFRFTKEREQEFIRACDPITIRFPHGVWANFYDWETDGYSTHGDSFRHRGHDRVLKVYAEKALKCGFPGLVQLNAERRQARGRGFDMMWTYNLNYNDSATSVARLRDSLAKGLEVQDIELGNEHFWKSQRSTATSTPDKYLAIAKSTASALRMAKPDVRVSIPLSWRRHHGEYNRLIADDRQYFDAISVHKYAGADPDKPGESDKAYSSILTARLSIERDVNFARSFAPGKPVWLTEWGVSCGSECQAAAALGMADSYLFLFENQDVYDRANWFSVNGVLNSFITISNRRVITYPLEKTYYGAVHQIVRDVFEDARMLHGSMDTSTLTVENGSNNAVNARAVTKEGRMSILAVNLSDRPAAFALKFNGVAYDGAATHEALVFEDLAEVGVIPFEANPLRPIKAGKGDIVLPPLSVNRISDIDAPAER